MWKRFGSFGPQSSKHFFLAGFNKKEDFNIPVLETLMLPPENDVSHLTLLKTVAFEGIPFVNWYWSQIVGIFSKTHGLCRVHVVRPMGTGQEYIGTLSVVAEMVAWDSYGADTSVTEECCRLLFVSSPTYFLIVRIPSFRRISLLDTVSKTIKYIVQVVCAPFDPKCWITQVSR
jgi:hypothetical protein